nr:NAD(P)/FAD-dependent oxidoreductase [Allomuricauda sp.]
MKGTDVLIIGGGLAGLTAALDLAKRGKQVTVVEKKPYPRHKVCGEYISNEVRPYLSHLGLELQALRAPQIDTLQLSARTGKSIKVKLPLGGFGLSRFTFENYLYQLALEQGVEFIFTSARQIEFKDASFAAELANHEPLMAKMVLGAYGKRSNLGEEISNGKIRKKSPWLAIKCHYEHRGHPSNIVGLHNFSGGYAGLSQVEEGRINLCYLAQYESFKKEEQIETFNVNVLSQNPFLRNFLQEAVPVFEKPLSIAQISFGKKLLVDRHMLLIGDAAGMIHPLCGNGMAMAIHSAKLASELVDAFLSDHKMSRNQLEIGYQKQWNRSFGTRLWWGGQLQNLMLHTNWFNWGMQTVAHSKYLVELLIRRTHGNPILS